ncbi:MAG TPA: glycosyl hydrolase [Polyangiaceae bacterium]|nr:glycosyl hydrolase [Polyangiaceae bacterium]
MLTRRPQRSPLRDQTTRLILSTVVLGLLAACGNSESNSGTRTGTAGAGGSSNPPGPAGTGAGGTGGASAGGAGGAGASGATTGAGGSAGATGTGAAAGAGGSSGSGGTGGAGGAGGVLDAGASTDARGSSDAADARDGSDAPGSSDITDAGGSTDAGARDASIPDVSGGDGGTPYKGVANSPCAEMATLGATWFYNWTVGRGNCTAPPFIPMVWGHVDRPDEQTPTGVTNAVNSLVSQGYTTVLGFNEPDNTGQSNMTVAKAISLWPSFNNPAIRIGSPATSANAAGQMWFADFMSQVNADTTGTLRVDFIAAHWYGWNAGSCEANASSLEGYIKGIEMIPGNRPIWLTEWGCLNQSNPDSATVVAFFKGAVAMFARHPRIERYAWYPWTPYNELFVEGGISPMGTAFAAAPQYK